LSVATSEAWKDKQSGEQKTHTEWHRVKCFGRLAEIASEYLQTGSKVYIKGRNRTQAWTDENECKRWSTFIKADEIQLLGNTRKASAPDSATDDET
jgi:single-strand DNA-binding protein